MFRSTKPISKRPFLPLAMTLLITLLGSCTRNPILGEVEKFTKQADQVASLFPDVAMDVYASCVRAAERNAIPIESADVPGINPFEERITDLAYCEGIPRQLSGELITVHDALVAYLRGLGNVASDKTVDFSGIDAIRAGWADLVLNIPGVAPEVPQQLKDSGNVILDVLTLVLNRAADRERLATIEEIMVSTNDDVQLFVDNFVILEQEVYLDRLLADEEQQVNSYYERYISDVLRVRSQGDAVAVASFVMNLQEQQQADVQVIRQKREAVSRYLAVLMQIKSDHNTIANKFNAGQTPSASELNQMMRSYTTQLEAVSYELEVAFSRGTNHD